MKNNPEIEVLLADTKTACEMLSIKKTKLFGLLKQQEGGLQRVKVGRKTLVTMESIRRLAAAETPNAPYPKEEAT